MALVKKLSKIGNSYGVILPNEILKATGFSPSDELEIEAQDNCIILRPRFKNTQGDKKVMQAMARFIKKYRRDLEKLA